MFWLVLQRKVNTEAYIIHMKAPLYILLLTVKCFEVTSTAHSPLCLCSCLSDSALINILQVQWIVNCV